MIINRILALFQDKKNNNTESSDTEPTDSNLSAIEDQQQQLLDRSNLTSSKGMWTAILTTALIAGGLGALGGRLSSSNSCEVNRPALLITKAGEQWTGILHSLDRTGAFFQKDEAKERYDFDNISRIVFFRDEAEMQNTAFDTIGTATALGYFPGQYVIEAGGHKGQLSIYLSTTGTIGAVVRFTNWGTKQPEYLTNVKVIGNQIDFRRSCTAAECRRIGSPHDFYQQYSGKLNPVRREIKGNYSGSHSSGTWVAKRQ